MTEQERIKKIKQAKTLIDEVREAMDIDPNRDEELGEIHHLLTQAKIPLHKAHLWLKRRVWRQPLGVK